MVLSSKARTCEFPLRVSSTIFGVALSLKVLLRGLSSGDSATGLYEVRSTWLRISRTWLRHT